MKPKYILLILIMALFAFGASADNLNDKITFTIDSGFDVDGDTRVAATLWALSDHTYFYVSDEYTEFMSSNDKLVLVEQLEDLGKEFEDNIRLKLIDFWGSEPNPGIDDDPKLTILITELVDYAGGYFNTGNSFSKDQIESSNERDMIYVNALAMGSPKKLHEFLAHEFQHLISVNHKELAHGISEDIWLNDARS